MGVGNLLMMVVGLCLVEFHHQKHCTLNLIQLVLNKLVRLAILDCAFGHCEMDWSVVVSILEIYGFN